jgi:hypothetical protein
MSSFSTPFWIVTDRSSGVPSPVVPDFAPGHVAAFTSAEKAGHFMATHGDTYEVSFVSNRTLPTVIRVYRTLGIAGFCFDPTPDGCCTFTVAFAEIV